LGAQFQIRPHSWVDSPSSDETPMADRASSPM
jgi:hypothetical protein